jgi:hypothetical protein
MRRARSRGAPRPQLDPHLRGISAGLLAALGYQLVDETHVARDTREPGEQSLLKRSHRLNLNAAILNAHDHFLARLDPKRLADFGGRAIWPFLPTLRRA